MVEAHTWITLESKGWAANWTNITLSESDKNNFMHLEMCLSSIYFHVYNIFLSSKAFWPWVGIHIPKIFIILEMKWVIFRFLESAKYISWDLEVLRQMIILWIFERLKVAHTKKKCLQYYSNNRNQINYILVNICFRNAVKAMRMQIQIMFFLLERLRFNKKSKKTCKIVSKYVEIVATRC